jgi:hypothetical protein
MQPAKEVEFNAGEILQNSMVEPGKWWRVVQTVDTVTPGKRDFNDASAFAKTVQRDGKTWGETTVDEKDPRALEQVDDLLFLPFFVDDELFRLSPSDEGKQSEADAPQRR